MLRAHGNANGTSTVSKWYVQSVISSETDDAPTNSTNTEIGDAPTNLSEYTSRILQQTNPPTQSDLMASCFLLDI